MRKLISLLTCFGIILNGSTPLFAEENRALREVECPTVIADAEEGTFDIKAGRKNSKYRCFKKARDAKKAGFKSEEEITNYDFTGWYRLNLSKLLNDTCGTSPLIGGGTFFLQLRQGESGVFGEFCPSIGSYTGYRSDSGVVISTSEEFDSVGGVEFCGSAPVVKQQFVELKQIVKGSPSFLAIYRTHFRCLGGEYSGNSCVREFSGTAFLETHTIWPAVAENIDQQAGLCEVARTKCKDCHQFLD